MLSRLGQRTETRQRDLQVKQSKDTHTHHTHTDIILSPGYACSSAIQTALKQAPLSEMYCAFSAALVLRAVVASYSLTMTITNMFGVTLFLLLLPESGVGVAGRWQ